MRKFFLLLPCCLLLLSPAFAQKHKSKSKTGDNTPIDLSEALAQKLVACTAEGTGGHQGESIKLICRNLRGQLLRIRIPQGQLMDPADSSMQTLVVAAPRVFTLSTKTPAQVLLKTFCTQAGDASPSTGTSFSVGAMAPDLLCRLLQYISAKGLTDDGVAQSAVWCITNGQGLASIGDADLTVFTAGLLGKKPPGYRVIHETREVPGQRAELGKAMVVESSFEYTLDKAEKLRTLLLDAGGKTIKVLRDNEPAAAGEHRSGLKLSAWNLEPGHYTVRVVTAGGRIIQDIQVEF